MSLAIDDDCPACGPDVPAECGFCDDSHTEEETLTRVRPNATRYHCPIFDCGWFHEAVASPSLPDNAANVPPWCTLTWAAIPTVYGAPLTDEQVIAAHMATHPVAERAGRMPSRAEVESALTNTINPRTKELVS